MNRYRRALLFNILAALVLAAFAVYLAALTIQSWGYLAKH